MPDDEELTIPVRITQKQIEIAVSKAVQTRTDEIVAEFKRSLALKSDELRDASRLLEDRVDAARDRVDTKIRQVDESLEGVKTKIEKRVNTYVIPAVILTFFAVVLAIFTAVGGFDVIHKVQELKTGVMDGTDSLADSNKKLQELQKELADVKAKADAAANAADAERYNALEKKYDDLIAQLIADKKLKLSPAPKPVGKSN
jgi:predicted  nucleic acid-binding Zn-ribbon protein